ncbi:MAG: B-box zinc finger protein [Polyangiales bacterium]
MNQLNDPVDPRLSGVCETHPDNAARGFCPRCSRTVCDLCTDHGRREECATCATGGSMGSFPFHRDYHPLGELIRYSFRKTIDRFGLLLVAGIIVFVVTIAITRASGFIMSMFPLPGDIGTLTSPEQLQPAIAYLLAMGGTQLAQALVNAFMIMGITNVSLKIAIGTNATFSDIFVPARWVWRCLGVQTVQSLVFLGIAIACLVPHISDLISLRDKGVDEVLPELFSMAASSAFIIAVLLPFAVYVWLGLSLAYVDLAYRDSTFAESIRRWWELSKNRRLFLFSANAFSLAALFLGMLACVVGLVFAFPFVFVFFTVVFLALQPRSGQLAQPARALPGTSTEPSSYDRRY